MSVRDDRIEAACRIVGIAPRIWYGAGPNRDAITMSAGLPGDLMYSLRELEQWLERERSRNPGYFGTHAIYEYELYPDWDDSRAIKSLTRLFPFFQITGKGLDPEGGMVTEVEAWADSPPQHLWGAGSSVADAICDLIVTNQDAVTTWRIAKENTQ